MLVWQVAEHKVRERLWPASIRDRNGCSFPARFLVSLWASEFDRCGWASRRAEDGMNVRLVMRLASGVARVIAEPLPTGTSR